MDGKTTKEGLIVLTFAVDQEMLDRLDDYRFENRVASRSEAIRRLVSTGLKVEGVSKTKKSPGK